MKNAKKIIALLLCAVLLVAGSVAGTLAYLTSKTGPVNNTFSAGNVAITLDEAKVTTAGVKDGDTRVTENEYHLLPGSTYVKDPTVHVDEDSEACWIFVEVNNGIADIEADTTIAAQMSAKGWSKITDSQNRNIYAHNSTHAGGDNVVVFENFTIKGDVENVALAGYAEKEITVTAYAVQSVNMESAQAAWNATFGATESEGTN